MNTNKDVRGVAVNRIRVDVEEEKGRKMRRDFGLAFQRTSPLVDGDRARVAAAVQARTVRRRGAVGAKGTYASSAQRRPPDPSTS